MKMDSYREVSLNQYWKIQYLSDSQAKGAHNILVKQEKTLMHDSILLQVLSVQTVTVIGTP